MGKRGSKTPAVLPLPITSAINAYRHPAEYSNLLSVRPLSIALKYLDMQNRKTVTPH